MKNYSASKIGILGGGQLAKFLALKCHEMGISAFVLSKNSEDPAALVCNNWLKGDINQVSDLKSFLKKVDIIIFESEFLSSDALDYLKEQKLAKVLPSPHLMEKLQDRLHQKNLLLEYKIPTSYFYPFKTFEELKILKDKISLPFVIKARKNGYDGKGTFIAKSWQEEEIKDFLQYNDSGYIVEEFISYKRELAISLSHSLNGDISFFPLVETFQEKHQCLWVKGPTKHKKIAALKKKLKNFVKDNKYYGLISFELFDTKDKLFINELAPRVHNSAHYSLDALTDDQFSQHLKAVLGLPLKDPKAISLGFAMYNLIGSGIKDLQWTYPSKAKVYWYGKKENRKARKMGHLNVMSNSAKKALEDAKKIRKGFQI